MFSIVQDKINKIKEGAYLPNEHTNKPQLYTKNSKESFPIRLDSNGSESSEDRKAGTEFDTPDEVDQLYKNILRNAKTNSQIPKVTTISQNSKNTNPQDSKRETQRDWKTTPLYEDFEQYGQAGIRFSHHSTNYSEDEIYNVYEFVKSRYNTKEYDKSVSSFYQKAMSTLRALMSSMSLVNMFNSIQQMYSAISVTNTLKLLIRCKLMFSAQKQVIKIFEHIRMFMILKTKVKNLISLHMDFQGDVGSTSEKLKKQ